MGEFVSFFIDRPLPSLLVGSHFLVYALVAWAAVVVLAVQRKMTRSMMLVLFLFVLTLAIEALQLYVDGYFRRGIVLGLTRYVGVFAPLLWVWTALVLAKLWRAGRTTTWRVISRIVVVVFLGWTVVSQGFLGIREMYFESARTDVLAAASRAAVIVKRDYAGPARQEREKRTLREYYTTRRPVVFSDISALAWIVRGQSEGAIPGLPGCCPYKDDYLFIRVGSGYGNIETVDATQYDYVTSVPGLGYEWRLFRRKTTPHRLNGFSE